MEMTDFDKYIQTFHDYRKTRIFWIEKTSKITIKVIDEPNIKKLAQNKN